MTPDITLQIREMQRHKYFRSEEARRDLGEEAYENWAATLAGRFRRAYEEHRSDIESICRSRCPEGCRGPEECKDVLPNDELYSILKY